jgi:hypothetical protein
MRYFFMLLILLKGSNLCYSQTSMDEYIYLTEGYKQQIKLGLNDKKGYWFEDLGNYGLKYNNYELNFIFKGLKSTKNDILVGILIEQEKKFNENKTPIYDYYCIPHPKSSDEIWNKALTKINSTNDKELLKAYNWALTKYISQLKY